ncbi:HipA N-terminal domain-containing protein [Actinoplanes sp. NBRC 101535]|uniref:HipA N-terminal domain-containing protein n=1 Tax=Actinoplanes sp. NBRC 101535 TaxID=3032196 RepID=UPI0024A32DAE|nr:HipA N-terminal domain-containing protein [Actinoplanes sp. NBRC 101535]GLY05964.1 hypothetical protein Acsp01_63430 [Actinoplanes sp. NBRC 101535]
MTIELTVLITGRVAGLLTRGQQGRLSVTYDEGYRTSPAALPLSLSMPLAVHAARCREVLEET